MNQASSNPETHILWRQVWGLSALLAAILLSFIAYGFYQAKILENLGFFALASWLGIFQGLLGAILEPLFGGFSDRILRRFGSRLPMISVGVTIAALLFVVLSLLLASNLPPGIRWLIPVLMTGWVMAMIIFRGPAIALLRQFAPTEALPLANSLVVVVLGLVGALAPLIEMGIKQWGRSPTFLLGAIVLVVGAILLYASTPRHTLIFPKTRVSSFPSMRSLTGLFLVGIGVGLEINLMLALVPSRLALYLPNAITPWITSAILVVCTLAAVPLGKGTIKLGISFKTAILIGLAAIAVFMGLTLLNQSSIGAIALILGFGIALGLVLIDQIPFALLVVSPSQAGLGTGSYLGGMGAGAALIALLLQQSAGMTLATGTL